MSQLNMSDERRREISDRINDISKKQAGSSIEPILSFNKTPVEIKEYMDQYVIGQEEGKKVLATAIAFHYKRLGSALKSEIDNNGGKVDIALKTINTPKANIMLIGPSGSGKTYTAEIASGIVGVPFVKEDMTKFSETGYVGQNTADILTDLYAKADGNIYLSQMGIVYLDEIDKIAGRPTLGRDVSGKGVQNGLLKIVEGVENCIETGQKKIPISTKNVLFIASGAYEGLDTIVNRRLDRQQRATVEKYSISWKKYLLTQDLVDYGMERQLMGRFPVRVVYSPLNEQDLKDIMCRTKNSPLHAYIDDLKAWGISLSIDDDALSEIAHRAQAEGTGARGLTGILNRVLLEDMYTLPGNHTGNLFVDREYVIRRIE